MKKLTSALAIGSLSLCMLSACAPSQPPEPKQYEGENFTTTAWWAPYEISEESFQLYKDAGLNTMIFVNHSRAATDDTLSDTRYYLGSALTMQTLEMCRKTGLDAIISEGIGYKDQGGTPFTENDLYGDYSDIIKGVHIADEPSAAVMREYCTAERIEDFKKVYSVPYIINLHPVTAAGTSTGTLTYAEYLQVYEECVLQNFPNTPYISVDFYPFHTDEYATMDRQWISCYEQISKLAAEYGAETNFYIQTSEGNEFTDCLTEADIRYQIYVALCFGGSSFSYYCYSVPDNNSNYTEGSVANPMYTACLLDQDNNPTDLYNYVKEINAEIQSFAAAFNSYSFTKCMAVCVQTYGADNFKSELYAMNTPLDFSDRRYIADIETEGNCLVGCFDRAEDEAYMLANYGYPDETDPIELTITLKGGATHIAVYGGDGYSGTPEVIAAQDGKVTLSIAPGDGKFVVPLL